MKTKARKYRVLTCVYCGQEYPQDTPAWGDKILTDHIKICEKHPMRKLESDNKKLRDALIAFVGAETAEELKQMVSVIPLLPGEYTDKVASINAIHALLETMPVEARRSND